MSVRPSYVCRNLNIKSIFMSPIPLYQTFTFILQHFSPFENFHPFFFILNVFLTAGKTFRLSSISCSFIFPEMRFWTIFMALQHVLRYHPRQLVNLSIFQISSPPIALLTFKIFFLNLDVLFGFCVFSTCYNNLSPLSWNGGSFGGVLELCKPEQGDHCQRTKGIGSDKLHIFLLVFNKKMQTNSWEYYVKWRIKQAFWIHNHLFE